MEFLKILSSLLIVMILIFGVKSIMEMIYDYFHKKKEIPSIDLSSAMYKFVSHYAYVIRKNDMYWSSSKKIFTKSFSYVSLYSRHGMAQSIIEKYKLDAKIIKIEIREVE